MGLYLVGPARVSQDDRERSGTVRSTRRRASKGTIVSPWPAGGVSWGGAAYDPDRHWMIVNTNRLMKVVRLTASLGPDGAASQLERRQHC